MSPHFQAIIAVYAARVLFPMCGRQAAQRFVQKRNVPFALYRLARQLEAVK